MSQNVWKALRGIFFFSLVFKFGAGLHYSLMSVLGERVLPIWTVGLIIGGASIVQMTLDVPGGFALDRFGYTRLLKIFTFVFIIGALVLLFGISPATFVATVILSTLGWQFYNPGTNAYLLAEAPREIAGHAIGLLHAFESMGVVLATVVLPFVILKASSTIGVLVASILFVALIIIYRTPQERSSVHKEEKIPRHWYYIRRQYLYNVIGAFKRLNPASSMIAVQGLAAAIFYGMIWFTIPLAIAQGLTGNLPGISLSIFDFAIVILGSTFGMLADRWNKRTLVIIGLLVFSVAGALLGFNFSLWFLLIGFIATAGDELSSVSLWAWMDNLDKNHSQDGLVNGVITFFEDLGWAIGPILAGVLFNIIGPSWVIAIGAGILFLAWFTALIFLRHPSAAYSGVSRQFSSPTRQRHKR